MNALGGGCLTNLGNTNIFRRRDCHDAQELRVATGRIAIALTAAYDETRQTNERLRKGVVESPRTPSMPADTV